MADKKYKLSLQLTFDGNQAKQEAQKTGKALESIADSQKGALRLLVDGSQARKELEAIADLARKTAEIIEKPRTFVVRPAVDLGVKQGTAPLSSGISGAKLKVLPGMDKQQLEKLDKQMAKSVLMTIDADGTPAIAEADKTQKEIDDKGKELKPWTVKMYDKAFKGFGGDLSKMTGLDKVNAGIQSGLGKTLGWLNIGFAAVGKVAGFAFRGISAGVRLVGSMIKTGLTLPVKLATGAFKALGVAAAAVGAGVYASLKAIGPAAEMEQYSIQLEVMLKSAAKAKERLAELSKYAKETNYGVKEIMEAGNLMEAFGFYSKRNLGLAGDAANAFGKDIREVIYSLNYLATGRGGEAFRSLAAIGVTRDKLEPYGIKFGNSGQLITDSKKAFDAVLKYFEDEFGGMTKRQSKTWRGAIQILGGQVYESFASGFANALPGLTKFVTGRVIPLVDSIGKYIEEFDWDKILAKPLKIVGGLAEMMRQAFDPKTRGAGMQNMKAFGQELWAGANQAFESFAGVGKALVGDLAKILEDFLSSDGLGKALDVAWKGLKLSWEYGASLMHQVLKNFSNDFQSNLKVAIERIPGVKKEETSKRYMAMMDSSKVVAEQLKKDNAQEYDRLRAGVIRGMRKEPLGTVFKYLNRDDIFKGSIDEWKEAEINRRIASLKSADGRYLSLYNRQFEKQMQFKDPTQSPFYRSPKQLESQRAAFQEALSEISIKPTFAGTTAALKNLPAEFKNAFSRPTETLRGYDAMGRRRTQLEKRSTELAEYRQALIDDPKLAKLRATGWTAKGQERNSSDYVKNLNYQQAREEHWRRSALIRGQVGNIDGQMRKVEAAKAREAQRIIRQNLLKENQGVPIERERLQEKMSEDLNKTRNLLTDNHFDNQTIIAELRKMVDTLAKVLEA